MLRVLIESTLPTIDHITHLVQGRPYSSCKCEQPTVIKPKPDVIPKEPTCWHPPLAAPPKGICGTNDKPEQPHKPGPCLPEPPKEAKPKGICNYGSQNLPSIVGSAVITDKQPSKQPQELERPQIIPAYPADRPHTKARKEDLPKAQEQEIKPKAAKQDEQKKSETAARSAEDTLKLERFKKGLEELTVQYGSEIIEPATKAVGIKETKILKRSDLLDNIRAIADILKYISKRDPDWKTNILDKDHDDKPTVNSIKEVLAKIACEDQNLSSKLSRSNKKGVDFFDESGQDWDVKRAISNPPDVKKFNSKKFIEDFEFEYKAKINIIIDVTELNEVDYNQLIIELKSNETIKLEKTIIVHRTDPTKSIGNRSWHAK